MEFTGEVDAFAADLVLRVRNGQDALEDGLLRQCFIEDDTVQRDVVEASRLDVGDDVSVPASALDHLPVKRYQQYLVVSFRSHSRRGVSARSNGIVFV